MPKNLYLNLLDSLFTVVVGSGCVVVESSIYPLWKEGKEIKVWNPIFPSENWRRALTVVRLLKGLGVQAARASESNCYKGTFTLSVLYGWICLTRGKMFTIRRKVTAYCDLREFKSHRQHRIKIVIGAGERQKWETYALISTLIAVWKNLKLSALQLNMT